MASSPAPVVPTALVAGGQACFLAMMGACLALRPSELAVKRGLSYYGNHLDTLVPFTLGFVLCVTLTVAGLRLLRPADPRARRFKISLAVVIAAMALIPATPYTVDRVFDYLHIGVSVVLFSAALLLGGWLALRVLRARLAWLAFLLQLGAGLCVLTGQIGWHDLMIPAQLAFDVPFTILLVLGTLRLGGRGAH